MTQPDAATIFAQVGAGMYEDALGVSCDAGRAELNKAHIRRSHRFRNNPRIREALNRAKGSLAEETPAEKGKRLLRLGRTEDALPHLRLSVHEDCSAQELHLLGYALYQLGRYNEARPHLDRAASLRNAATDHLWLGNTLERLGKTEDSLRHYEAAVSLRGHEVEIRLAGNALYNIGRYDDALKRYEMAMRLGGAEPDMIERVRKIKQRRRSASISAFFKRSATRIRGAFSSRHNGNR